MISLLADAEPRAFILFLGAGASRSSGIPLASEMIRDWRQKKFKEEAPPSADFLAWCGKDNEYSLLFENLYPDEYARQRYIQGCQQHACRNLL